MGVVGENLHLPTMDSAMRDIERIEEAGNDRGHRFGAVILALVVLVAVVVSVGLMVSDSETPMDVPDPLASLDRVSAEALVSSERGSSMDPAALDDEVSLDSMAFPETLGRDERPEVQVALIAAAAEYEHPDPIVDEDYPPPAETSPSPSDDLRPSTRVVLPAAVAAGPGSEALERGPIRDPLMEAVTDAPEGPMVATGSEGPYTIQVISYQNPEQANAFADTLRERGHRAFVVSADIPGRGMHWRVRVGPFETERDAEGYRDSFEAQEQMNTIVIRRDAGQG